MMFVDRYFHHYYFHLARAVGVAVTRCQTTTLLATIFIIIFFSSFFSFSVATYSHRGSARFKKSYLAKVVQSQGQKKYFLAGSQRFFGEIGWGLFLSQFAVLSFLIRLKRGEGCQNWSYNLCKKNMISFWQRSFLDRNVKSKKPQFVFLKWIKKIHLQSLIVEEFVFVIIVE